MMGAAEHTSESVCYTYTTFEWDRSPYPSVPDHVLMVHHFDTDSDDKSSSAKIEVGKRV